LASNTHFDLTANGDRYSRDKCNENSEVIKNFISILVRNIIIFVFLIHSKTKFFATIKIEIPPQELNFEYSREGEFKSAFLTY
jgi:hypothetical protein